MTNLYRSANGRYEAHFLNEATEKKAREEGWVKCEPSPDNVGVSWPATTWGRYDPPSEAPAVFAKD